MPKLIDKKTKEKSIDLYSNQKLSLDKVSEIVGISCPTICNILRENGHKIRTKNEMGARIDDVSKNEIVDMYENKKMKIKDISKIIGYGTTTINRVLREKKCKMRRILPDKKTEEIIIDLYINQRMSAAKISGVVGFCSKTVLEVVHRKGYNVRTRKEAIRMSKETEHKIIDLYNNKKMKTKDISKIVEFSKTTILAVLRRNGIEPKSRKETMRKEIEDKAINLYINEKLSSKEAGKLLGIHKGTIIAMVRRRGFEIRPRGFRELPVKEIINLYTKDKKTLTKIMEMFKVSYRIIKRLLNDNNVKTRSAGGWKKGLINPKTEDIKRTYLAGNNASETARINGVSPCCVLTILNKYNIERHSIKFMWERLVKTIRKKRENGDYDESYIRRYGVPYRDMTAYWESLKDYKKLVMFVTRKQNIKTLKNYEKRGSFRQKGAYHLDHKFSIAEGFKQGILPEIIGNINNLEFIPWKENIKKKRKCSILLDNLMELIDVEKVVFNSPSPLCHFQHTEFQID